METSAYRLLYDNIHDFKTTAVHVEAELSRHNIRSVDTEAVQGMQGRQHHEMWASMKTVSHFNLGIALELMLKLLLFLNKVPISAKVTVCSAGKLPLVPGKVTIRSERSDAVLTL